jgi:hypothetical protein
VYISQKIPYVAFAHKHSSVLLFRRMKVLITGATGSIGGKMLQYLLLRPEITSVVALSRREVISESEKLRSLIVKDFLNLDPEILANISDADAMVWAMGTYDGSEEIDIKYPLAFQEAFVKHLSPERKQRFKYIHLSGCFCEKDQSRSLWFLSKPRRIRGRAEALSLKFAENHANVWQTFAIRPGGIMMGDSWMLGVPEIIFGTKWLIRGDELGIFVADLVVTDAGKDGSVENRIMVEKGRELRKARK